MNNNIILNTFMIFVNWDYFADFHFGENSAVAIK